MGRVRNEFCSTYIILLRQGSHVAAIVFRHRRYQFVRGSVRPMIDYVGAVGSPAMAQSLQVENGTLRLISKLHTHVEIIGQ